MGQHPRMTVHRDQVHVHTPLAHEVHVLDISCIAPTLHAEDDTHIALFQNRRIVGHHDDVIRRLVEDAEAG